MPSVVRLPGSVQVWSPAKVNLHLEVLGKRTDGYHDLATLIVPISLHDTLDIQDAPSGGIELECDEPSLPSGPGNLVFRAATLMRDTPAEQIRFGGQLFAGFVVGGVVLGWALYLLPL